MSLGIAEFDRGDAARRGRQGGCGLAADARGPRPPRILPSGGGVVGHDREMLETKRRRVRRIGVRRAARLEAVEVDAGGAERHGLAEAVAVEPQRRPFLARDGRPRAEPEADRFVKGRRTIEVGDDQPKADDGAPAHEAWQGSRLGSRCNRTVIR